ncbi:putative ribonuclease H protein [Glycine soja]|nr:putative ribonuclease H protein [Glycine max]
MAVSFLSDVASHPIQPQKGDQWVWKANPSGQYTPKSAYDMVWGKTYEQQQDGVFQQLWKLKLPSKITMFAWRLIKDRLSTRTNLQRRQIQVGESTCPFCREVEESTGHLFFHCGKIMPVWWESLSWVGMLGVFPNHPRQHFLQHIHGVTEGMRSSRWKWWWLALTWTIWKQRNNIIFSNGTFNANSILDDAVFLLWTWLTNLEKDFNYHYYYWSS